MKGVGEKKRAERMTIPVGARIKRKKYGVNEGRRRGKARGKPGSMRAPNLKTFETQRLSTSVHLVRGEHPSKLK